MGSAASASLDREFKTLTIATGADDVGAADTPATTDLEAARAEIARLRRTLKDQLGAFSANSSPYAAQVCERTAWAPGSEWARVSTVFERDSKGTLPTLFGSGGISNVAPGDVIQSSHLGDCYFVAALSVVAERPALIKALFPALSTLSVGNITISAERPVTVRLFHQNQWREVHVDDWFATEKITSRVEEDNVVAEGREEETQKESESETESEFRLFYARSSKRDALWVSYLEKAYATIYGSYAALAGGDIAEALGDLTGCPVLSMRIDHEPGHLWKSLRDYQLQGQLLACGWCGNGDAVAMYLKSASAFVFPQHAYAIVDFKTITDGKSLSAKDCYVQLRNPWGNVGCAARPVPKLSSRIRKALQLGEEEREDGTFWLSWENFTRALNCVYVCLLNVGAAVSLNEGRSCDDPPSVYEKTLNEIVGCWSGPSCGGCSTFATWRQNPMYTLLVHEAGKIILTLTQDDQRLLRRHTLRNIDRLHLGSGDLARVEHAPSHEQESENRNESVDNSDQVEFRGLTYHQVGLEVIAVRESDDPASLCHPPHAVVGSYDVVGKSAYWNKRNVSLCVDIGIDYVGRKLLLVPSTYFPGEAGRFLLSMRFAAASQNSGAPTAEIERVTRPIVSDFGPPTPKFGRKLCFGAKVSSEWSKKKKSAGGRLSQASATFHQNPQWSLKCDSRVRSDEGDGEKVKQVSGSQKVRIVVFLRNNLLGGSGKGAERVPLSKSKRPGMGLCTFLSRTVPCVRTKAHTSLIVASDQVGKVEYSNALEVALSLTVEVSDFPILLVPATYKPGTEAPFTMEVLSDYGVQLSSAPAKRPPGFDKKLAAKRELAMQAEAPHKGSAKKRSRFWNKKASKKGGNKVRNGGASLVQARKAQTQVGNMYADLA